MANGKNLLLSIIIGAKDKASGVLGAVGKGLKSLDNTATRLGATLAGVFAGISVTNFFRGAIGSARDLEAQLARVQAATGATAEEMAALRAAAEQMGADTRFTATEAAQGLEILGRAGVNAANSVKLLPTVLRLAQADGMDLATAAGIVTDSLGTMGEQVDQAARFADVLAQGARLANTDVTKLGFALSYAGVQAAQAGMDVEQTVAILDALANAGIRGERAGTALRSILGQLADPAGTAREELRALGIDTADLGTVIAGLEAAGAKGEAAILAFGLEAGPGLRTLLQAGTAGLAGYERSLRQAAGTAQDMAAAMDDNLDGATRGLGSAWDALRQKLVKPLIAPITREIRELTARLREFAGSDTLAQLSEALVTAFNDGATAVRGFVGSIDFNAASTRISEFTQKAAEQVGGFLRVLNGSAAAIQIVWNGVSAGVMLAGATIAKALQLVAEAGVKATSFLQQLGLVSAQTVSELETVAGALGAVAASYLDQLRQDGEDIRAAWAQFEGSIKGQVDAHGQAARAAQAAAEAQRAAAAKALRPIEAVSEAYGNLYDQIQALADRDGAEAVRQNLAAMFDAGAVSAQEYEALLGRLGDRVVTLTGTTEAAANKLQNVNVAAGLVRDADAAKEAFEALTDSIRDAADTTDTRQLETAFRGMFLAGEISAKQFDDALAQVKERQAELRGELASTRQAADSVFDGLMDGLRTAETVDDIRQIERALVQAFQSGKIAAAELAEGMEAVKATALEVERASRDNIGGGLAAVMNAAAQSMRNLSQSAHDAFQSLMYGAKPAGSAAEQLQQRIEKANLRIRDSYAAIHPVMQGFTQFFRELDRSAAQVEAAWARQALAVEHLTERAEAGRMSLRELEAASRRAARGFDLLDEQQLSGLRSALSTARSEAEALTRSIEGQVESLQDELARLRGDQEAIERRQFERRKRELEELRRQASEAGDAAAQAEARRALQLLEQVQGEAARQRARQAQAEAARPARAAAQPVAPATAAQATPPRELGTVTFQLPSGRTVTGQFDDEAAGELLRELAQANMRTS